MQTLVRKYKIKYSKGWNGEVCSISISAPNAAKARAKVAKITNVFIISVQPVIEGA